MNSSGPNTTLNAEKKDEMKTEVFGTTNYSATNPLNKPKLQALFSQCVYSQQYKFLTGKDTKPCGQAEHKSEGCQKCQRMEPFFMRLEWTREIPANNVAGLGPLIHQSFPLPNGCRLVVFTSEQEAKQSPWGTAPFVHGAMYVFVNQQGQQAVCFHACPCCKQCELKPIAGQNPSLFCKNANAYKIESSTSRSQGLPTPSRFVFNENTFPANINLPSTILMRKDKQGQISYLTQEDIVCFFGNVQMPFKINNNTIIFEISADPFENLYRPDEYDVLPIPIFVYRKGAGQDSKLVTLQSLPNSDILYKSTFCFYMQSPELAEISVDSDSDDEEAMSKGVKMKRFDNIAEHLQIAMTYKAQEAFYTLIQGYLRGSFLAGSMQERLQEREKRNLIFADIMKQDRAAARKWTADMLNEVAQYYLKHCTGEPDFRDGLLQFLDFTHSLGATGVDSFRAILSKCPFVNTDKPICFRFPRRLANEIRNMLVTVSPDGSIKEEIEVVTSHQRKLANDDWSSDFDIPAFATNSISNEPSAYDKLQKSEERLVKFPPPTDMHGKPYASAGSEVKDNDNPLVNPNLAKIITDEKSLTEQLGGMNHAVAFYPTEFKVDKESVTNMLKAIQEAGYMSPMDANNSPVSDITKSYWQAGLQWGVVLWPYDLTQTVKGTINENKFIILMGNLLNSKLYTDFGLAYAKNLHVSHLRKLFKLYTNTLTPVGQQPDPKKPEPLMGPVAFVQCVLLMLTPNNLQRPSHRILAHHGPLDLGCAIDCIYDALVDPKTEAWLTLFRGPLSRPCAEASWRAYKASEKKDTALPLFMRLPEIRIEGSVAFGLNLMMSFERKNEFTHIMLAVDVFDEQNNCISRLLDSLGGPQKCVNDWLLNIVSLACSGDTSGRKARYMPRKRYKEPLTLTSE